MVYGYNNYLKGQRKENKTKLKKFIYCYKLIVLLLPGISGHRPFDVPIQTGYTR
jgi:hypothetical protein